MSYEAEVMADNPVAFWFVDLNTNEWVDETANELNLTVDNATVLEEGPGPGIPRSLRCNGSDSVAWRAHESLLTMGGEFHTIEFWIRRQGSQTNWSRIIGKSDSYPIFQNSDNQGSLRYQLEGGTGGTGGSVNHTASGAMPDDEWVHIVCRYRSADDHMQVLVDGVDAGSTERGGTFDTSSTTPFAVAASGNASNNNFDSFYAADYAAIALYDYDLTTARLDAHRAAASASPEPPWELTVNTEGEGSVAKDPDEADYADETPVELTATPDSGWQAADPLWTGDVPSGNENDNPLTITMDADKSLTANFDEVPAPEPGDANRRVRFDGQWWPAP